MTDIAVKDRNANVVETLALPDHLFGKYVNHQLLRDVVAMYEANRRLGTASTKTLSEVAGSGRKPWRQKGTGRARAGTAKSPLWRGGGVTFGPKPRDYSYSMPRKALRKALACALLAKVRGSQLHLIDSLEFDEPKTKEMAKVLSNLKLEGSVTVVVGPSGKNVHMSVRNIPKVQVRRAGDLNARDVLLPKNLLVTKEAFEVLRKRVAGVSNGGSPR